MLTIDQQRALLLTCDDNGKAYSPDGFDYAIAYLKVAPLRSAVETTFGGECFEQNPRNIQDKCVYGELFVPKHLSSEKEWTPCIVLCTFGEMVAVSGEAALTAGTLDKLICLLDKLGFNYISEALLHTPYSGDQKWISTWWQRYFDYL